MINLYHKQCSHCGLKYFGKTTLEDPYTYPGSGIKWKRHWKKYGKDKIKTLKIWKFTYQSFATAFALKFSRENNIVKSKQWANLMEETGTDRFYKGLEPWNKGIPMSEETKEKCSISISGANNPNFDSTIYEFFHPKYGIEKITRLEFKQKYEHMGVCYVGIRNLIDGNCGNHKGWKVLAIVDNEDLVKSRS